MLAVPDRPEGCGAREQTRARDFLGDPAFIGEMVLALGDILMDTLTVCRRQEILLTQAPLARARGIGDLVRVAPQTKPEKGHSGRLGGRPGGPYPRPFPGRTA